MLSDFETRFEARRWSSGEIDRTVGRHGRASLRVSMGTEKYAGTTLKRSFGDWRGHCAFAFSLYNPDPEPGNSLEFTGVVCYENALVRHRCSGP